jgi:hypothetical protein
MDTCIDTTFLGEMQQISRISQCWLDGVWFAIKETTQSGSIDTGATTTQADCK